MADRPGLHERRAELRSRVTREFLEMPASDDRAQALGAIVVACGLRKKAFRNVDRRFEIEAELSAVQPAAAGVQQAIGRARFRAWFDVLTP